MFKIFFLFLKYVYVAEDLFDHKMFMNDNSRIDNIIYFHGKQNGKVLKDQKLSCFLKSKGKSNSCDFKESGVESFLVILFLLHPKFNLKDHVTSLLDKKPYSYNFKELLHLNVDAEPLHEFWIKGTDILNCYLISGGAFSGKLIFENNTPSSIEAHFTQERLHDFYFEKGELVLYVGRKTTEPDSIDFNFLTDDSIPTNEPDPIDYNFLADNCIFIGTSSSIISSEAKKIERKIFKIKETPEPKITSEKEQNTEPVTTKEPIKNLEPKTVDETVHNSEVKTSENSKNKESSLWKVIKIISILVFIAFGILIILLILFYPLKSKEEKEEI